MMGSNVNVSICQEPIIVAIVGITKCTSLLCVCVCVCVCVCGGGGGWLKHNNYTCIYLVLEFSA